MEASTIDGHEKSSLIMLVMMMMMLMMMMMMMMMIMAMKRALLLGCPLWERAVVFPAVSSCAINTHREHLEIFNFAIRFLP